MAEKSLTIVTGASRGIGSAIALSAAGAGHDLALIAHREQARLDTVAAEARSLGAAVSLHLGDVSSEAEVARLFGEIKQSTSRITGLVNNAGFAGDRGNLADVPMEVIDRIFAVNVRGTILMSRHAVPLIAASGGGAIVNLSSQSAVFGGNGLSAYASSKAAITGLTVSLAREVAPLGIRVNAVSPGPVMTEPLLALPAEQRNEMAAGLPMGRFCTADEVGRTVVWLLSPEASYISGAIVPVHGAR